MNILENKKRFRAGASLVTLFAFLLTCSPFVPASAAGGNVMALSADSSAGLTVSAGQDLTLDLNGHTLTSSGSTVITNNGTLMITDTAGGGKITKTGSGADTWGIVNNGTLTIASGTVDITTVNSGAAYGINNTTAGTLSITGGSVSAYTTGSAFAMAISNTGTISVISGGSVAGKLNNASNPNNGLGISNESTGKITLISGGIISGQVNCNGMALGIRNRGTMQTISGGTISALTTGTNWPYALWNTSTGTITQITGGVIKGITQNSSNGNNALGINNEGVIGSISAGEFYGSVNGSGNGYGVRSSKTISSVSGGAYRGNNAANAIYQQSGTITYAAGYSLVGSGVGFQYVMPAGGYFVQLLDEYENWQAAYTYDSTGTLTASMGDHLAASYTVYDWHAGQSYKTATATPADFSTFGANTSLTVKTTDTPVYYFLGSSVTYGAANGGVSFADYMAQDKGWICLKKAVSGTTLVDSGADSYISRMKSQIGTHAHISHFICQLSTNDATQNKPLGQVSGSKNLQDFDTSTIIGAMEYIICYAKTTWGCPVSFYTNPNFNNSYYEQMVSALYQLQNKWGVGIVDFYYYKDMTPLSSSTLSSYMADAIHPNAQGYHWIAGVMENYLQTYKTPPATFTTTLGDSGTLNAAVQKAVTGNTYQMWVYQKLPSDITGQATDQYIWVPMKDNGNDTFTLAGATGDENGNYRISMIETDPSGNVVSNSYDVPVSAPSNKVKIEKILVGGKTTVGRETVNLDDSAQTSQNIQIVADNAASYRLTYGTGENQTDVQPGSSSNTFPVSFTDLGVGAYTFTATATGASGQKITRTFTVIVYSTTGPGYATPVISGLSGGFTGNTLGLTLTGKDTANNILQIGDGFQYRFRAGEPGRSLNYSASSTNGPAGSVSVPVGKYGTYQVYATAAYGSSVAYDDAAMGYYDYTRPGGAVTVSSYTVKENGGAESSATDQTGTTGKTYSFNAIADTSKLTGGETARYSFWRCDASGWVLLKDWSPDATLSWTPAYAGKYIIQVRVQGSKAGSYESARNMTFDVASATGLVTAKNVSLTLTATGNKARQPVTLTTAATPSAGLLYRYQVQDPTLGLTLLNTYSPDNTFTWVPRKAGSYTVYVQVINQNSFGMYDAQTSQTITIS